MFRPGNLGHLGRLGLVATSRPGLVAQALAILAKYGSAANLYLPGVGAINGITAGNWLDTVGGTPATVDGAVGTVVNARGGANLTQSTAANSPVLRRGLVNLVLSSGDMSSSSWTASKSVGATVGAWATGPDGQQSARLVTYSTANEYLYQGLISYQATVGQAVTMAIVCNTASSAGGFGGGSPAGTDIFAAYSLGNGWWLQTIVRTFTVTTSANTLQPLPGSFIGLGAATVAYHRVGLFVGTVTAQQIIDAGGIPLTTTATASSTNGPFAWRFDGSNDSFSSTLATGNEGWMAVAVKQNTAATVYPLSAGGLTDPMKGINLRLNSGVTPQVLASDGTLRQVLTADASVSIGSTFIHSCGWDETTLLLGVNNTEKTVVRTRNPTSPITMTVGAADGTGAGTINGYLHAIVHCQALPTASERATLRQFIASLSGVTM